MGPLSLRKKMSAPIRNCTVFSSVALNSDNYAN